MDKKISYSIFFSVIILFLAAIFDIFLNLGKYSGIVFFLYSYYGLATMTIIYLLLSIFNNKKYLISMLIQLIFMLILFFISLVLQ